MGEPESVWVLESFGKLWKLKMPFPRTMKVLEKRKDFQNGYGEVLVFYFATILKIS